MEPKQVLIVVLSILLVFVLLVMGLLGVVKFYPQYVGLPAPVADSTQALKKDSIIIPPEPQIVLKQYVLDSLQTELMKRNLDSNDKKSVVDHNKYLLDSISKINKMIVGLQENIFKSNDSLGKKQNFSSKLSDSLSKLHNMYQRAISEIAASKEKIKSQEKAIETKIDTLEKKNFETFAKIYNGANPTEVAKILEQIDERDAAKILKMMQKKKASKVLEAMKPEQSAAILLLGNSN
jgi:flagellar motility protein MotE (MotC chaperone)